MVRVRDYVLAVLRPEPTVRVAKLSLSVLAECFDLDLVQRQTLIFRKTLIIKERKLGVVHVEDQRPVLEMLRQNAELVRGQPRLGDENHVSVYVFGHFFHLGEMGGESLTKEVDRRDLLVPEGLPYLGPVSGERGADDFDVELPTQRTRNPVSSSY